MKALRHDDGSKMALWLSLPHCLGKRLPSTMLPETTKEKDASLVYSYSKLSKRGTLTRASSDLRPASAAEEEDLLVMFGCPAYLGGGQETEDQRPQLGDEEDE